jgi:GTP-dependent phosphoenolpyruvate carboxykinase
VDAGRWLADLPLLRAHYEKFGSRLPVELREELDVLEQRLLAAK